nr:unnamed protein product [Callosobruchus analis]
MCYYVSSQVLAIFLIRRRSSNFVL